MHEVASMQVDFYFGAMSPFSWLTAERIGGLLPQARWRPLFLGGLFMANGRRSWGLTDEREAQMAECERRALEYGLGEMRWPEPWPTNDLMAARAMTFAGTCGRLEELSLATMRIAFLEGRDLGERANVLEAGERAGIAAAELDSALEEDSVKAALRAQTDEAGERGVFGVPTLAVDDELFWGDERLEQAMAAVGDGDGAD
jgi:2-hydroxychromene-2-carboxylate isomerase